MKRMDIESDCKDEVSVNGGNQAISPRRQVVLVGMILSFKRLV